MIVSLTKIRQHVLDVSERGLSWEAYTSDGLMGRAPGVVVVMNRSRRKALPLESHDVAQVGWETNGALVGTYDRRRYVLGPQSAVLFKALE
jgi:neopullulanase